MAKRQGVLGIILCQSLDSRTARETAVLCQIPEEGTLTVRFALEQCVAQGLLEQAQVGALVRNEASNGLLGIWGKRCNPDDVIEQGARLELYRPLVVDPKTARRERFKTQGAKTAGLFASRRPGAKPGY